MCFILGMGPVVPVGNEYTEEERDGSSNTYSYGLGGRVVGCYIVERRTTIPLSRCLVTPFSDVDGCG